MTRRAGLWAVVCVFASCNLALSRGEVAATLKVTGDAVQPAGVPIILTLTVRNTGTEPISYWIGSAGGYLNAAGFTATVSYASGGHAILSARLSNSTGEFAWDAGHLHELKPGESLSFPAALRPLPAADYSIQFSGDAQGRFENGQLADVWFPQTWSAPLKIQVRTDETLAAARGADLIAKVRKGDPFAEHVAARFPRTEVRQALEQALSGDDIVAAEGAMDALWPDYEPPPDAAPLIAKAIRSHLKPINEGHDEWLMHVLLRMSQQLVTPEMEDAVRQLASERKGGRVQRFAEATLHELRIAAAKKLPRQLADSVDDPLIEALLKRAQSADAKSRAGAIKSLGDYPYSPRAVRAVIAALKDKDGSVREVAERAWRKIENARLNHG